MSRDEVVRAAVEAVRYARTLTPERGVLGRGRLAQRPGLPLPHLRGRHRSGRDHGEPARHGRLRHPPGVRRAGPLHPQPHAQHRQGRAERPLPQRPGPGHLQHARGHPGGRAPGRGHDQRHRRARRQHLARGGGHGAAHARRLPLGEDRHSHRVHPPHQPAGQHGHGHARAGEQGHRRGQRLRARGRHPPGRDPQKPDDLRDHESRRRSASAPPSSSWASTPAATPCAPT